MSRKLRPQIQNLSKVFAKFGVIGGIAFAKLYTASPRLQAQMALLSFEADKLFRLFGDQLAPMFEALTDIVSNVVDWFKSLPEPLQNAITFGGALAVALALLAGAFLALQAAISPVTIAILAIAAAGAILYIAWEQNFGGIRDIVENVFNFLRPLFENFLAFIKDFIDLFLGHIGKIVGVIENVLKAIDALFKGDFSGALDFIVEAVGGAVDAIINWFIGMPLGIIQAVDKFTGGLVSKFIAFGKELLDAFIAGVQKALEEAGGIVAELLQIIADFLGGSLPKRGPLRFTPQYGEEIGKVYVESIGRGIASNTTILNRNISIQSMQITAEGADMEGLTTFGRRISDDVLRSSAW